MWFSVLCKHVQHAAWGCMIYLAYLCFSRLLCATEKPARVQRNFLFFSCLSFRENLLAPLAGRSENHNKLRSDGTWHQAGNWQLGNALISLAKWANKALAARG